MLTKQPRRVGALALSAVLLCAGPAKASADESFSSEFAIGVGTMMSVKNPDPLLLLFDPLPNAGVVVIQGNPRDGWTLVSWNGKPVWPGWAAKRTGRDPKRPLCLTLDAPTASGVCAAKPPVTP